MTDKAAAGNRPRRRFPKVDWFIVSILAAVVVATLLPAQGRAAEVFTTGTAVAIAVLFFMYGGRLSTAEALAGLKHWRLHAVILGFTFLVFPLIGLAFRLLDPWLLPTSLVLGLLYLCASPSTVQSSITFTSIAGGNIAGAVVSASVSNLLGVFLTPLIVFLTMNAASDGVGFHFGAVGDLVVQILIPFVVGQLSRPLVGDWLKRNNKWLKYVDRGIIVAVVYKAFSMGMVEGMWTMVSVADLLVLTLLCCALVAFMLWFTWWLPGKLGFNRADRIAIQFCGTKKSLATGVPMALVLFPGTSVGLMVLPIMIFHQIQLMACSVLAQRYGRQTEQLADSQ